MSGYLRFRSIAYDAASLSLRAKSYTLFKDERLIGGHSVDEQEEKEIVRWLFSKPQFSQILFEVLGHQNMIQPFLEVPRGYFRASPQEQGDFDAIYCRAGKFEELTCIEFKRVKVDQEVYGGKENINGLTKLERLVHQGNLATQTGFHSSYIAAVSLIDVSKFVRPNVMTKFEPTSEYKRLYRLHNFGPLDLQVGTILIEIVQTTGKDFKLSGQLNVAVLRPAIQLRQKLEVTEDFRRVYYQRELRGAN